MLIGFSGVAVRILIRVNQRKIALDAGLLAYGRANDRPTFVDHCAAKFDQFSSLLHDLFAFVGCHSAPSSSLINTVRPRSRPDIKGLSAGFSTTKYARSQAVAGWRMLRHIDCVQAGEAA